MCTHNASGHGIGCQAVRIYIYIYSDKHTSTREEIKISPPNLSEGGSLRSPIMNPLTRGGGGGKWTPHSLIGESAYI